MRSLEHKKAGMRLFARLDLQVMLKRCAETKPWSSARSGESERRLAEKILVEFVL